MKKLTERIDNLTKQVNNKIDKEDVPEFLGYVADAVKAMAEYVKSVCNYEIGIINARAMADGGFISAESYRDRIMDYDTSRKMAHDAAMSEMACLNRICEMCGVEPICPDPEVTPRGECGNFCAAVTAEFFLRGTGRDDEAVRKAAELFHADPSAMDKIVDLVQNKIAVIETAERRNG